MLAAGEGRRVGHDTNKVTLIGVDKNAEELPLMSKADVARRILDHLERLL